MACHKKFAASILATAANLTAPHLDARFRSCAINTGAFTDPAFQETRFHGYQPPQIPAIFSGRPSRIFALSDLVVSINAAVFP